MDAVLVLHFRFGRLEYNKIREFRLHLKGFYRCSEKCGEMNGNRFDYDTHLGHILILVYWAMKKMDLKQNGEIVTCLRFAFRKTVL